LIEIWPIPYWLKIGLGCACLIHVFIEFSMTLIYAGIVYYPNFGPSSFLAKSSFTSMLRSLAFAFIFFFVEWPKLISYLLIALMVKAGILLLLAVLASMNDSLDFERRSAGLYALLLAIYGGGLIAFLGLVAY
jgi:hypothetical protein